MKQVKLFKIESQKIPALITSIVNHDMPLIRQNIAKIQGNPTLQKLAKEINLPERVDGIYQPTGESINFSRIFGKHKFTDEEVRLLLQGQKIEVKCKSKNGRDLIVAGKLGKQIYKGKEFWGFTFKKEDIKFPDDGTRSTGIFKPTGETITFKNIWSDHQFTATEIQSLLNGEQITVTAKSKQGTSLSVTGKLAKQEYKGKKYWGFSYDRNNLKFIDNDHFQGVYAPTGKEIRFKNAWSTHKFTDDEKEKLLQGKKIRIKLRTKKGFWYATGGLKEQEYKGKKVLGLLCRKKRVGIEMSKKTRIFALFAAISFLTCGCYFNTKEQSQSSNQQQITTKVGGLSSKEYTKLANLNFKSGDKPIVFINRNNSTLNKNWVKNRIDYQNLDSWNRTSASVTAFLDENNLITNSQRTRQIWKPTGWHSNRPGEEIYNRGHLIAYSLSNGINKNGVYTGNASGDLDNPKNLFTQTAFSNQKLQTYYERQVREALYSGQKVIYQATPIFRGDEKMARGINLQAISTNGMLNFNVYLFNVQPGYKFNYQTGRAIKDNTMKIN